MFHEKQRLVSAAYTGKKTPVTTELISTASGDLGWKLFWCLGPQPQHFGASKTRSRLPTDRLLLLGTRYYL